MESACRNCRFWVRTGEDDEYEGDCRRHAPRPVVMATDSVAFPVAWPYTADGHWCGEWEATPQSTEGGGG